MSGPHQGQPVYATGRPLAEATSAMILVHGRGATAKNILELASALPQPEMAYLAPQAASNTWYPYSFLAPLDQNEPGLSSGLEAIGDLLGQVEAAGIPAGRILLAGFSQGGCLTAEYVARNARRYGGLLVFSGGLIGPPGTPRSYPGSLADTPVFLGCSDVDPHVPLARVEETADVLTGMGAVVDKQIYPRMGHAINEDEIARANRLIQRVVEAGTA
ncbi:MAG: dienelactone hydrolase family protein [Chloroflexota bacterium]